MQVVYDELYKEIIEKHYRYFNELNIISGYASANFLERVINEFPNKNLNLFIGMTQHGLSKANHKKFIEIVESKPHVSVYYQVKGFPTHIKALEFINENDKKTFVGSANFTRNGFIVNREVMVEVEEEITHKIHEQFELSLSCNDPDTLNHIKLFDDIETNEQFEVLDEQINETFVANIVNEEIRRKINSFNFENKLFTYSNTYEGITYLSLPIILTADINSSWMDYGANSGNGAYINNSNLQREKMVNFFGRDKKFKIKTFDGIETMAELKGKFGRELYFYDLNINTYIKKLMSHPLDKIITNLDLYKFGYDNLYFKKIKDDEFLMTLQGNSEFREV
jgi:hypothetical protein